MEVRKRDRRRAREAKGDGSLNELNVCHPVVRHYSRLTGRVANPISNIFSSLRRISGPPLCCQPNGLHVVVGSAPRASSEIFSPVGRKLAHRSPSHSPTLTLVDVADLCVHRVNFSRFSDRPSEPFNAKQRPVDLPDDS